ncbi:plasmid recombination protein [Cognatiyoonia sp. IB215446]|uniref:plasmid recombination protein n=1 Tax=Cognatiyoonia sp. IB215446 TaxID=3097355 RepID=UPI002A0F14CB|nr:plasmid recombination protein [Cognatiyoonia sp. IB215446]MDX8350441.1 plasmid recombination protein [Cognatiyoonia sp. IB215446]
MARRPRKPRAPRGPRQKKERALAGTGSIVTNFRQASRANLKGATLHQTKRSPDGWSAIDLSRVNLNEVWVGSGMHILNDVNTYLSDVVEPTHKNSSASPFCTIILGASPEYFRPNGEPPGQEDPERLEAWKARTKAWMKETFGDDLVSAIYNGDETTPHVHLAICPTYLKRPRKPDRKKPGESDEAFLQRCEDWKTAPGTKTLSWSSNEVLGRYNSFGHLRQSYADALKPLGLEYSLASFEPAQYPEPKHKKKHLEDLETERLEALDALEEERAELAEERRKFEQDKAAFEEQCAEIVREELRSATEEAVRISKITMAAGQKVAARIEANAKYDAEQRAAEQTAKLSARVEKLARDEERLERQKREIEDQVSWFALFTSKVELALQRALDRSFDTTISRDQLPASPSTTDWIAARGGNVTHGLKLEFFSLHSSTGVPIPLPSQLKDLVRSVFKSIQGFAQCWRTQHRQLTDLRNRTVAIAEATETAEQALADAGRRLAAMRQETMDAEAAATKAYDEHAELSYEFARLDEALAPARPAYEALQNWLSELQDITPNEDDTRSAKTWINQWMENDTADTRSLMRLTLRLQGEAYTSELEHRLKSSDISFPTFSRDIRDRWREVCALPFGHQHRMVRAMKLIDRENNVPLFLRDENENALAKHIAQQRAQHQQRSIPPLARQFLDLPEDTQTKLGAALKAQDDYNATTVSSGLTM